MSTEIEKSLRERERSKIFRGKTTMVCILCKTKSLILKVPSRIIKMIFTQKLFLITLFLRLFKFFKNNRIIKKNLIKDFNIELTISVL